MVAFNLACETSPHHFETQRLFETTQILSFKDFVDELASKDICCWNLANKAFKKNLYLKAAKIYLEKDLKLLMAEDALIFFEYCQFVKKVAILNETLYFYRTNENSATLKKDSQQIKQALNDEKFVIHRLRNLKHQSDDKDYKFFIKTNLCLLKSYHLDRIRKLDDVGQKFSRRSLKDFYHKILKKIYKIERYLLSVKHKIFA